jgi:hypothetical protein
VLLSRGLSVGPVDIVTGYGQTDDIHSAKVEKGSEKAHKHAGLLRCVQHKSNIRCSEGVFARTPAPHAAAQIFISSWKTGRQGVGWQEECTHAL